jgi:S-adenosylmethionine:tRNA ribosyltransferase-isomerase
MKLSHFQFNLPKELLAEFPAENRDESRLMVINREKKTIEHKMFKDIIDYFDDGDVMILNNKKAKTLAGMHRMTMGGPGDAQTQTF